MANLFNQLERSLRIHKTKTKAHDTELRWVGWDIDLLRNMVSADQLSTLNEDSWPAHQPGHPPGVKSPAHFRL